MLHVNRLDQQACSCTLQLPLNQDTIDTCCSYLNVTHISQHFKKHQESVPTSEISFKHTVPADMKCSYFKDMPVRESATNFLVCTQPNSVKAFSLSTLHPWWMISRSQKANGHSVSGMLLLSSNVRAIPASLYIH